MNHNTDNCVTDLSFKFGLKWKFGVKDGAL